MAGAFLSPKLFQLRGIHCKFTGPVSGKRILSVIFGHLRGKRKGLGFSYCFAEGLHLTQTSYEVPVLTLEQDLELGTLSCVTYCHHYQEKKNFNFSPQAALKLVFSACVMYLGSSEN